MESRLGVTSGIRRETGSRCTGRPAWTACSRWVSRWTSTPAMPRSSNKWTRCRPGRVRPRAITDRTGASVCWPRRGYKGVQDATGDGHVVVADDRPVYTLKSSPAVPASYEEAIERARALKPRLRERVPETERLRRLPAENVADLLENGLYGL